MTTQTLKTVTIDPRLARALKGYTGGRHYCYTLDDAYSAILARANRHNHFAIATISTRDVWEYVTLPSIIFDQHAIPTLGALGAIMLDNLVRMPDPKTGEMDWLHSQYAHLPAGISLGVYKLMPYFELDGTVWQCHIDHERQVVIVESADKLRDKIANLAN